MELRDFYYKKHYLALRAMSETDKNLLRISKEVNITYSHLNKISKRWEEMGLICMETKSKDMRSKRITLTKEGDELLTLLNKVNIVMEQR